MLAQLIAFSHTIVLLEGAFGLYLLAGGYRAQQQLHYVYGVIPAGAVLFGYSARTPDARRNLLQFSVIALAHLDPRAARIHDRLCRMNRRQLHIDPFVRNLAILCVVAAGVTAIGRTSSRVLSALYLVASLALIVGLVLLAYRVWRENRGTFSLMSTRLRLMLYGSVLGLVVVIATSSLWVTDLLTSLLFFGLIGGLGYVIWRVWEESRRYYY